MARKNELLCFATLKEALLYGRGARVVFDNSNGAVQAIVETAEANPAENEFPDFISPNGALEHFEVSSSSEFPRGGSKYKRDESENRKKNDARIAQNDRDYLNSPSAPGTFAVEVIEDVYEGFSYTNFILSLKKYFDSHISSLSECERKFVAVAFFLEMKPAQMSVWENGRFKHWYFLHRDREALELLARYSNLVRYVIYLAGNTIEILDLSCVGELMSAAESGCDIRCGRKGNVNIKLYFTV